MFPPCFRDGQSLSAECSVEFLIYEGEDVTTQKLLLRTIIIATGGQRANQNTTVAPPRVSGPPYRSRHLT